MRYKAKRVKTRRHQEGVDQFKLRFQGEAVAPLPIYWYHSKGNWLRYNYATDSFYETLQQTSRPLLSKIVWKTTNLGIWSTFWVSLERRRTLVRKSVYDFLFAIIELFSLALTVDALQGKTCQDSLLSGGGRSVWAKISGGRGHPSGIFFGFYKTRHILLCDSANCTVLRTVVLTQH